MDDIIDEIALTLLDHGYDHIGFRQIVDQICKKMEEYEEYREDERTRRDMEEAAQADIYRADYLRKRDREDRHYETDWIEMSESFGMKKIYIASPYTVGDVAVNVKRQMDAASKLIDMGYAPFWPLHSHFLHMAHPKPYEKWIALDLQWILSCDALLRLDGVSRGAHIEVQFAEQNKIPVFSSINELTREW